jgi:hypothetical protein
MFYLKWIGACFLAAHMGVLLIWPVMNEVSYQYGSLYLELMMGGATGVVMAIALYWVMRDLILSFGAWVGWTALAHGFGAFLGAYVMQGLHGYISREWMMVWGIYVPKGLMTGLLVGIWVGIVQGMMLPLLDAKRWIVANVLGFGVGYVLSHAVGNWLIDLPQSMSVYFPGFMGICVGSATLYVFLRSEFGDLRG